MRDLEMMFACILVQEMAYLCALSAESAVPVEVGEIWLHDPARLSSSLLRDESSQHVVYDDGLASI
jgi:hypothetical protein